MNTLSTPLRKLTKQQSKLLLTIYLYRYITPQLLSSYRKINLSTAKNNLTILYRRGIIKRRYLPSYKLLGKAARYYLSPIGFKLLASEYNIDKTVLKNRYRDGDLSEEFVTHELSVFRTANAIEDTFKDVFSIWTKANMSQREAFLKPFPDLYLQRRKQDVAKPNEYLIDLVDGYQFFVIKKRITFYITCYEEGEWDSDTFPNIILLTSDTRMHKRIKHHLEMLIEDGYIDDEFRIVSATPSSLLP